MTDSFLRELMARIDSEGLSEITIPKKEYDELVKFANENQTYCYPDPPIGFSREDQLRFYEEFDKQLRRKSTELLVNGCIVKYAEDRKND